MKWGTNVERTDGEAAGVKRRSWMTAVVFLSVLVTLPQTGWAAGPWYVDPAGSDSNDCLSPATACLTIGAAITKASPGDTVTVAPGTYGGNITINKSVTLVGDPGDASPGPGGSAPVIDGGSVAGSGFFIANTVSNVTIQGFEIRNFTSNDTGIGNGISAWVGSTSNITIQDNYFHNLGYNGVLVGNDKNADPNKWGDHTYWTIKGNILETFEAYGFELTNASNSSIEDNVIHSNATWNLAATCIMVDARRNESGIVIRGNQLDGEMWPGYPALFVFANSFEVPNVNLDNVLIEENLVSTSSSTGASQVRVYRYAGSGSVTNVRANNNSLSTFKNDKSASNTVALALLDAATNWWGVNTLAGVAAAAGANVDYTPWLDGSTDTSGNPGFQGDFSVLDVDDDSPQSGSVGRIQEGIDLSLSGGTVNVAAGTYVEQVVDSKTVTLAGAGAGTTTIQAPGVLTPDPDGANTVVLFTGPITAEFSGFTVQGPVNGLNFGIYVRDGATASIHDNVIRDIRDEPLSGAQYGYGIEIGKYHNTVPFVDQIGHATITNNTVYGYQKTGIECEGTGSSATITGNVVTGAGLIPTTSQNGIQIRRGATGSITSNVVTGNAYTGHEVNATGISVTYPGNDVIVQSNIVNHNTANIYTYEAHGIQILDNEVSDGADGRITAGITADADYEASVAVTISGNSVNNNLSGGSHQGPGIMLWGVSGGTVTENVIVGSGDDGMLIGASANIDISCNRFSGNGLLVADPNAAAIDFGGVIPELESYGYWPNPLGGFSVHGNSFVDNRNGIWSYDAGSVDATSNWWGATDGPGGSGPGSGDAVSANVAFAPWAATVPACVVCDADAQCSDGLFCSGQETCSSGSCTASPGDPCSAGSECANACNETADNCNDLAGTSCTDDGNVCTTNACDGSGACTATSNTLPCDDALFCNGADTCAAGSCTHTGDPCSGGTDCANACNESVDNCLDLAGTACTDDGNVCTTNACNGSGACSATNNTLPCDDALFCNGADTCTGGSCTHAGDPCTGGTECANACNEAATDCNDLAGTSCTDDGNFCTTNACNGSGACAATNNTLPCDDGVACTLGDTCAAGACTGGDGQFSALCPWTLLVRDDLGADRIKTGLQALVDGDICASQLVLGASSVDDGSVVAMNSASAAAVKIGLAAEITGDIVSGGGGAKGKPSHVKLPYTGVTSLAPGSVTAKDDASGDYDLSGAHALVAACADARDSYASASAYLAGLAPDLDAGTVVLRAGESATLVAPIPGTLNVVDVEDVRGASDTAVELDGGGNADTAIVLRVAGNLQLRKNSSITLTGGLTPDRVLIYVQGRKCDFGNNVQGAGTLLCVAGRIQADYDTVWTGAWLAGKGALSAGDRAELTYVPFQAF